MTLTESAQPDVLDLRLCAAAAGRGPVGQRGVAHGGGVAQHAVGGERGAEDGARLRDGRADDGGGRSHGQGPLSGHVCHSGT